MRTRRELLVDLINDNGVDILFSDERRIKAIFKDYKFESKDIVPLQTVLGICSTKEKLLTVKKESLIDEVCDESYLRRDSVSDIIDDLIFVSNPEKKKRTAVKKDSESPHSGNIVSEQKKCVICGNPSVQTKVEGDYLCRRCMRRMEEILSKDYSYDELVEKIDDFKNGIVNSFSVERQTVSKAIGGDCCICGKPTGDYEVENGYCCKDCIPDECTGDPLNYTAEEIGEIIRRNDVIKKQYRGKVCEVCGKDTKLIPVHDGFVCSDCMPGACSYPFYRYDVSEIKRMLRTIQHVYGPQNDDDPPDVDQSDDEYTEEKHLRNDNVIKRKCCICGKSTGDYEIENGYCCKDCIPDECTGDPLNYTAEEIEEIIRRNKTIEAAYRGKQCVLCNGSKNLIPVDDGYVCSDCMPDECSFPFYRYKVDEIKRIASGDRQKCGICGSLHDLKAVNDGYVCSDCMPDRCSYPYTRYSMDDIRKELNNSQYADVSEEDNDPSFDELYNGSSTVDIPGKGSYEGNLVDGKCSGYGRLKWLNGDEYEGYFSKGEYKGKGILTTYDGNMYDGIFSKGKCSLVGKMTCGNGYIYEGKFVNGKLNGDGSVCDPNWYKIKGKFVKGNLDNGELTDRYGKIICKYKSVTDLKNDPTESDNSSKRCKSGKRSQRCKIVCDNGDYYEGECRDGVPNGKGKFVTKRYVDEGTFSFGLITGPGTRTIGSDVFEGTFSEGELVGEGSMKRPNGDSFVIKYLNNSVPEPIKVTYSNGNVYQGQFVNFEPRGHGKLTKKNGNVYTGHFSGEKISGIGSVKCRNGDLYEGTFQDSELRGTVKLTKADGMKGELIVIQGYVPDYAIGSITYSNGDSYVGDIVDGKVTGTCRVRLSNGAIYEGNTVSGRLTGKCKMDMPNGDYYEGDNVDGVINGKGKMTYSHGDTYEGDFVRGMKEGTGRFTKKSDGSWYDGRWEKNVRDGPGVEYVPHGLFRKKKVEYVKGVIVQKK